MENPVRFVDQTGKGPEALSLWPSVVIPKETIDA